MHFGSTIAIFKASAKEWQTVTGLGEYACKGLTTWEKAYPKAKQQRKFLEKYQVEYLKFGTEDYPLPLSYCSDAPILLFNQGTTKFKDRKIISVVATRQNTPYGKAFCEELIRCLRPYNPIICSGLARGIDIIAHRAALKEDLETLSCLAHGLDFIYPKEHSNTAKKLVTKGVLLTDFFTRDRISPGQFSNEKPLDCGHGSCHGSDRVRSAGGKYEYGEPCPSIRAGTLCCSGPLFRS